MGGGGFHVCRFSARNKRAFGPRPRRCARDLGAFSASWLSASFRGRDVARKLLVLWEKINDEKMENNETNVSFLDARICSRAWPRAVRNRGRLLVLPCANPSSWPAALCFMFYLSHCLTRRRWPITPWLTRRRTNSTSIHRLRNPLHSRQTDGIRIRRHRYQLHSRQTSTSPLLPLTHSTPTCLSPHLMCSTQI